MNCYSIVVRNRKLLIILPVIYTNENSNLSRNLEVEALSVEEEDAEYNPSNSKPIICQRCFNLDTKGTTELRSGEGKSIPSKGFEELLRKTLTPGVLGR